MKSFRNEESRQLMKFTMAMDPFANDPKYSLKSQLRILLSMGAYDIRPDYMLIKNETGHYDQSPDPCAWNGKIKTKGEPLYFSLMKTEHEWFIVGS